MDKSVDFEKDLAIDCEAMGLNYHRDRLCLLQISDGNGTVHIVQFLDGKYHAPNLKEFLADKNRQKIFHFARFDLACIEKYLSLSLENIYCTKIASKIARTYTDSHGLKELCRELLSVGISKQQQSSDWGSPDLSHDQLEYAGNDVLYLHKIRDKLNRMLRREKRFGLLEETFKFLPSRVKLDLLGWDMIDIFAH